MLLANSSRPVVTENDHPESVIRAYGQKVTGRHTVGQPDAVGREQEPVPVPVHLPCIKLEDHRLASPGPDLACRFNVLREMNVLLTVTSRLSMFTGECGGSRSMTAPVVAARSSRCAVKDTDMLRTPSAFGPNIARRHTLDRGRQELDDLGRQAACRTVKVPAPPARARRRETEDLRRHNRTGEFRRCQLAGVMSLAAVRPSFELTWNSVRHRDRTRVLRRKHRVYPLLVRLFRQRLSWPRGSRGIDWIWEHRISDLDQLGI
jgi:hypothetical protein